MRSLNADTMWTYGVQYRKLAQRCELIGGNDLWIAATALAHGLPLATANFEEFKRVEGLQVIRIR